MSKNIIRVNNCDYICNAIPDRLDFRDKMYEPELIDVPAEKTLGEYRTAQIRVRNQGSEGACTGFGLATVVDYLLHTHKKGHAQANDVVSTRMLYTLARRYDEWPGSNYEGSSARGAMKAWHKHGVCQEELWPYRPGTPDEALTEARAQDALNRPLGAYFRVNHRDLVAMHTALAEVGALYVSAQVHSGWMKTAPTGHIAENDELIGGHAFALVGYDRDGFWLQNSWGTQWGKDGYAHISYSDWLKNGSDAWVARLGVPIRLNAQAQIVGSHYMPYASTHQLSGDILLRPHVISLGNDGGLKPEGRFGTTLTDLDTLVDEHIPRITKNWSKKRIALYAHGGLASESTAIERIADYREVFLKEEIYPISFIWHSDFWSTLKNVLGEATNKLRPKGIIDDAKDFLLDRLDDSLEPLARLAGGKVLWDEMKENAGRASTQAQGGASLFLDRLSKKLSDYEIHLIGHSAGAVFHAHLAKALNDRGVKIASCTLWAPACTVELFDQCYKPLLGQGIKQFNLYTLTDKAEQDDDCARIYNKSLLYLVSNAFEEKPRIPLIRDGVALLGMEKFVKTHLAAQVAAGGPVNWFKVPDNRYSKADEHGEFDDDSLTVKTTLTHILGTPPAAAAAAPTFNRSRARLREYLDELAK